jgi:hypothetical protein
VHKDRYAGLLVNLHCVGLYNRRYGTDPSLMGRSFSPEEQQVVREFKDRLEAQQGRLRAEMAEAGTPASFLADKHVWTNYKLLQMFDRLSLYLCMPPFKPRPLGPAPVDYDGQEVEFSLQPEGGRVVTITPYPFGESPLKVSVEAQLIPQRPYETDQRFCEALAGAEAVTLTFELRAE